MPQIPSSLKLSRLSHRDARRYATLTPLAYICSDMRIKISIPSGG